MDSSRRCCCYLPGREKKKKIKAPPGPRRMSGTKGRPSWPGREEGKLPNERDQFAPRPLPVNPCADVLYSNGRAKTALFEMTDMEMDRVTTTSSRQQTRLRNKQPWYWENSGAGN